MFKRYYFIDIFTNFIIEKFFICVRQMADVGQSNSSEALEREIHTEMESWQNLTVPYAM